VLEPNLDWLPIQHCWPGDPAPFITFLLVITADPATKTRNIGIYRRQKIDKTLTFMYCQVHKDGRRTGARPMTDLRSRLS
jgi:4-hydroxy-3-polyprenylbenzoate decarboxylase